MDYAIRAEEINLKYKFVRNMSIKQELSSIIKRKKEAAVKEVWALKNVSFSIEKGQTVGIIGSNGAGKSTLLKTIAKIFEPDSGVIDTGDQSVSLLALGTGFQGELSGIENIYSNGLILGLTKKEIDEKLKDIIQFSGVEEFIHHPLKAYSSGMKSRLAFSIACYVEPDILLIDEVLGVGDQNFMEKSSTKIRELIHSDRTVLLVSHSLPVIRDLCNKVIWLEKGELMGYGDTLEVTNQYLSFLEKTRVI
jgi:ABC-type polysaccharide/polyol phosphate transport system ATPase subunit